MHQLQKTVQTGYLCKGMLETESNKGVYSIGSLKTVEKNGENALLEKMLERDNLNLAYKRVKQNGGAAGHETGKRILRTGLYQSGRPRSGEVF